MEIASEEMLDAKRQGESAREKIESLVQNLLGLAVFVLLQNGAASPGPSLC